MRVAFVNTLLRLLGEGRDIHVLTADIGYGILDPFRDHFPDRFTNVGVAEANMIGVAAGMAMRGTHVFCYSIAPFVIFRTLDQVRCDLCSQGLPVTLVSVGAGLSYGMEGMTHYAIEDLAITRALPGMNVFVPASPAETAILTEVAAERLGPSYLRLGAKQEPEVYPKGLSAKPGKVQMLREGKDAALIANGVMVRRALETATRLAEVGLSCAVFSLHTLKPLDTAGVLDIAKAFSVLVSLEEHSRINGMGSAIAELLVDEGVHVPLLRIGLPDEYPKRFGDADWLRDSAGLDPKDIAQSVLAFSRGEKQVKP